MHQAGPRAQRPHGRQEGGAAHAAAAAHDQDRADGPLVVQCPLGLQDRASPCASSSHTSASTSMPAGMPMGTMATSPESVPPGVTK